MIIEIRRAGFVNKGAELMLHAVVQKLRERYPTAKLAMPPVMGGADDTFEKMRELNLYPSAWFWQKGIDFERFANFVPRRLLKRYGFILLNEVDVVIDVAGFAYSDQMGVTSSRELSSSSARWKKNGTKLIMLPQALGPFKNNNINKYVRNWVNNADLIFARELDSYAHLTELVGKHDKIKVYPDFTNLIEGTLPDDYDQTDKRVAIIPNFHMIDKTGAAESEAYLPFLIRTAQLLIEKNSNPFLLVHEGSNDLALAEKVSEAVGGIPIVQETDPLHIKGILGSCLATVGSRFHGLVSALSQGVPSLATGWSHKYKRLFEEYGFIEGLVSVTDFSEVLSEKIDLLVSPDSANRIRAQLDQKSLELKKLSENMWNEVYRIIDEVELNKR